MEKVESQGQRLSSYASSSSNKLSPKTPKKSTDKLSTRSTSKEESLSPHHLMSGYSYSSINSQSKDPECALKCTCNNGPNYNSLKSIKSNNANNANGSGNVAGKGGGGDGDVGGSVLGPSNGSGITVSIVEKQIKISKISCDAATSPNRYANQRSPQPNLRLINNKKSSSSMCNELHISDDKKINNKISPSPRRLVTTRNAATSPHLDVRKHIKHEFSYKSPELTAKIQLEKSNSLGESKPSRPLRTTRSLSPRPPVRHQHAIMVSDENDIVSVKVSPNDDYDADFEKQSSIEVEKSPRKKHKAASEQTSPNLSEYTSTFTYDKTVNKSTSCLVYVPSDPWMKMSDIEKTGSKSNLIKDDGKRKILKISQETRSLSRGNLEPLDTDPWIWRKPENFLKNFNNTPKRSPKQELYRQTKSFSTTKFEISDTGKALSLIVVKNDSTISAKSINRPKLQRCKSPLIIDDDKNPPGFNNDTQLSCTCKSSSELKLSVPSQQPPPPPPPQQQQQQRKDDCNSIKDTSFPIQQNKTFLNVINPNLMQSRHSFSSISQKDEELQLNIRRLSEQIKHNTGGTSSVSSSSVAVGADADGNTANAVGVADFTDYLNQFRTNETQHYIKSPKNSSKKSDSVLETTC